MLPDPGALVSLTPLADAVLADATLTEAMGDAKAGLVRALDLTGPAALRPFLVKGLVDAGTYRPVIDRTYELGEIVEAVSYVETGQKAGNVVIRIGDALRADHAVERADHAVERSEDGVRAS